jgi:hypothetical protein
MFLPRGIPQDVDDETYARIAHSFYVVRMVRYALLAGFLVLFTVGFVLKGWPTAATTVLGLTTLGVLVLMVRTRQRFLRGRPAGQGPTSEPPSGPTAGPTSQSPTG